MQSAIVVIIAFTLLCYVSADYQVTCGDGFPGRCELVEPGFVCDGGWQSSSPTNPCSSLRRSVEPFPWRCCRYPVRCGWPGYGSSGTCMSKYTTKCPSGNRFVDVGNNCPAGYYCCVQADYRPPEPCTYSGRSSGLCIWPEQSCYGDKHWGPCGLYRQCCTPKNNGPTNGPAAPPTYGPPAPTAPPKEGLYSLLPTQAASAYLAGWDSKVQFKALNRELEISSVTFLLNGSPLGQGYTCGDGNDWCYDLNFKHVTGASVLTADPDVGPSVTYQIPLIKLGFLLRFLTGRVPDATSWSGSYTQKWIDQKGSSGIPIPEVGFTHSWETSISTTVTLAEGGSITFSGSGSRSDTFKPDCCEGASGSFSASVSLKASLVNIGGLVKEPQISSGTVGFTGQITMPSVYQFHWDVSAFGVSIGVDCGIDGTLGTSVSLGYVPSSDEFFGLPVQLNSVSGNVLTIGLAAHAKVHAGPLSAGVSASASLGPQVTWTQADGLKWNGIQINAKFGVDADYFFSSAHINIFSVSDRIGLKKRNSYDADVHVQITEWRPIENVWHPHVTSYSSPYLVEDLYPSAFTGVGSVRNYDVMLWSSFHHERPYPHNLHVQYAVRYLNGNWSEPQFIPHSNTSVGMPALEDVESTQELLLVASQVTKADPAAGASEARLVESRFDVATRAWSVYKPLFQSHPADVVDWLPVFSEDGLWVVFIRATLDAAGDRFGRLMVSNHRNHSWSEPQIVMEDSNPVMHFSIGSHGSGNAMVVYQLRKSQKMRLCYHVEGDAVAWQCILSDLTVLPSSTPNVVAINNGYMVAWHTERTIWTAKLAYNGTVLDLNTLSLQDQVATLVTSLTTLATTESVIVGWTSWGANSSFHYALADASGKLHHSPKNVAPQIDTSSSTFFNQGSMQLTWTGSRLLYATMLNDNRTGVQRGTFAAFDLEFESKAHINSVVFDPPDFSTPLVNVTATLSNHGLAPLAAGGEVVFNLHAASGIVYVIGSASHASEIKSGESTEVSVIWNTAVNTTDGGHVTVNYFGSEAAILDEAFVADPATYGIADITITSGPTERSTAVAGNLTVEGPASGTVELKALTRMPNGHIVTLGSMTVATRPRSYQPFLLPLNMVVSFSNLMVQVIGKNTRSTIHTTPYDPRYDFAILLSEIKVASSSPTEAKFSLAVPVHNVGTSSATIMVRASRIEISTGASEFLAVTSVFVEGNSIRSDAMLELTLPKRSNMVLLEISSEDQLLPELNTDNNRVLISLQNHLGSDASGAQNHTSPPATLSPSASQTSPPAVMDDPSATLPTSEELSGHSSQTQSTHRPFPVVFVALIATVSAIAVALILAAVYMISTKRQAVSESPYFIMSSSSSK